MGKIIELNNNHFKSVVLRKIEEESALEDLNQKKRENSQKVDIHNLDVRDRNLKYFKNLVFTIIFVFLFLIQFKNYFLYNISISRETVVGIAFISFLNINPKNILTYFKKTPP